MHLKYRNVNDAFTDLVSRIHSGDVPTVKEDSRNGAVLRIPEPVTITYLKPQERVLFNPARDQNCFFTIVESVWMMAGRNDVAPLAYYNSKISEIASDDGEKFNGAYGARWRDWRVPKSSRTARNYDYDRVPANCTDTDDWRSVDQLDYIVDRLKNNPHDRRCVLEMWSVHSDLLRTDRSCDVCCNLSVCFSIREETRKGVWEATEAKDVWKNDVTGETKTLKDLSKERPTRESEGRVVEKFLDMTVFNRSNDLIWGCLGANAVHFSILLEYMAARLGVDVGVYNQISNNLHVYEWNWKPKRWLEGQLPGNRTMRDPKPFSYDQVEELVPIRTEDVERLDKVANKFVDFHSRTPEKMDPCMWGQWFLDGVVGPMCNAFHCHKRREYRDALLWAACVGADDWRYAAYGWINKRVQNWERKRNASG